ncbi:MAG: SapC family protein [Rubrivivax sp.]
MIIQNLHRQPVALDRNAHKGMKLKLPHADWGVASKLNSLFVAAVEFGDACKEYPLVFVRAGNDEQGKPLVAPVAVFGLAQEENLFLQPDGSWRASYVPAVLRMYPFAIARVDANSYAICVDSAWSGVSTTEGQALFGADGQPSEMTLNVQKQLEQTETEVQRTRAVGERLLALDLLRDMRFDATLPDGKTVSVDGFLTVDEDKLKALPDATLVELQRTGLLGLIHAHQISLGNMRRLAEWRLQRMQAAAGN